MRFSIFITLASAIGTYALPTTQVGVDYDVIMAPSHNIASALSSIHSVVDDEKIKQTYSNAHFGGFSGTFTSAEVETLRKTPGVLAIDLVSEVHIDATRTNAPWGLQRLSQSDTVSGANPTATSYTYTYDASLGSGVDIYMIDTGIRTTHTQFGGRATMGFSAYSSNTDDNGHGTHVSGTAAGSSVGVSSKAKLIGVKVLDSSGSGTSTSLISGIDYVISQHNAKKGSSGFVASVASMSLGFTGRATTVETALKSMSSAGVHISVAAGNSATNTCNVTPGALGGKNSNVIAVGASDISDEIAYFSNTGPCTDVYAPGVDVFSSYNSGNSAYEVLDGTSMATPHVSGLLAYYAALNPGISTANLKALIVSSAVSGELTAGSSRPVSGGALIIAQNGEDA